MSSIFSLCHHDSFIDALLKFLSGQRLTQADRNTPAKVTQDSVFIWMMIGQ